MIKKSAKRPTSKQKRNWKIGSAIIIAFFALIISFLIWFFYVGSTKEIVAIADQFKPDPAWQLKSETIEPPRSFCLDVECPSVSRKWKIGNLLNRDEFAKLVHFSGWNFDINGNCVLEDKNRYSDSIEVCSASGTDKGYKISITVTSSNPAGNSQVGLFIKKE